MSLNSSEVFCKEKGHRAPRGFINNQSCTCCHAVKGGGVKTKQHGGYRKSALCIEIERLPRKRGDSVSQISYFGHEKDGKSCSSTVATRNTK